MTRFVKLACTFLGATGLVMVGYWQGYIHGMIGGFHNNMDQSGNVVNDQLRAVRVKHSVPGMKGSFNVTVLRMPFGMHMRLGSTIVADAFMGFPAYEAGIREGCELKAVAGVPVKQGTYQQQLQSVTPPFNMSMFCPEKSASDGAKTSGHGDFRALVTRKPFGMDIQVNNVPRVVRVVPGYPAENVGVRRGFVLVAVDAMPVDASTWFDAWQYTSVPCILSFDTDVPLEPNDPFFNMTTQQHLSEVPTPITKKLPKNFADLLAVDSYGSIKFDVETKPFGMNVHAVPGRRPEVVRVSLGMAAADLGIRVGDVLVEVAGKPVDSDNWFTAFEESVPPFGIKVLRRGWTGGERMGFVGNMTIVVEKRPFGMHVRTDSGVVDEVFDGFPARKAGIREGCLLMNIAGTDVSGSGWMTVFTKAKLPFNMSLNCPMHSEDEFEGSAESAETEDGFYKVVVTKKPFGMHVRPEFNSTLRVIEVLPGSPAEKAGVTPGFILVAVNDDPVSVQSWHKALTKTAVPYTLTFNVQDALEWSDYEDEEQEEEEEEEVKRDQLADAKEYAVRVSKKPFGIDINSPQRGLPPVVESVREGLPAAEQGVQVGDVLIEVAGVPVTAHTWFTAFNQAVMPFGLRFRRPVRTLVPRNASNKTSL